MTISIGTNLLSKTITRQLSQTERRLSGTLERLASGQRINKASDDAAGLALSMDLNARQRVYSQGIRNVNDGISALSIADLAVEQLGIITTRQMELANQAANGALSSTQRASLDLEAQALRDEFHRIIATTTFNGQNLLSGSGSLSLQAGFGAEGTMYADFLPADEEYVGIINSLNLGTDLTPGWITVGTPRFLTHDVNGDGSFELISFQFVEDTGVPPSRRLQIGLFQFDSEGNLTAQDSMTINIQGAPDGTSFYNYMARVNGGNIELHISHISGGGGIFNQTQGSISLNSNVSLGNFTPGMVFISQDSTQSTIQADLTGNGITDFISGNRLNVNISFLGTITDNYELAQNPFSLDSTANALIALDYFNTVLEELNKIRSRIGASESRLSAAISVLQAGVENYAAAESRIKDADIANESAELVRNSILQSASASLLALANQSPALVLSLLE